MAGARHQAIDAADEPADTVASGERLNELEDAAIVGQKIEEVQGGVFGHAQLDADRAVDFLGERSAIDLLPDVVECFRGQQRRETDAVAAVELRLHPPEIVGAPRNDRA